MSTAPGEISDDGALGIARDHWLRSAAQAFEEGLQDGRVQVIDREKCRLNVFLATDEPTWVIYVPWGDGLDGRMLRSSRVIVISKIDGRVAYDGSAHDEG